MISRQILLTNHSCIVRRRKKSIIALRISASTKERNHSIIYYKIVTPKNKHPFKTPDDSTEPLIYCKPCNFPMQICPCLDYTMPSYEPLYGSAYYRSAVFLSPSCYSNTCQPKNSKTFNPCQIIIRQPRKKWGKELVNQSSRRDDILGVFACANSMNFQNASTFC
jgi:hypothetical protein